MENDTQKIITNQLAKLPANVRNAIISADYRTKLQTITKDNKLMIDQAGKLEMETLLVMLGLEPLDDYTDNLVNNASLSRNQAIAIAHDVNELIFKNIRESLKKINNEAASTPADENQATPGVWKLTNVPVQETTIPEAEKPIEQKVAPESAEIENDLLPEIYPEAGISAQSVLTPKQNPYHENISPLQNIVQSKMTETVVVPKEKIVIEEKTKLPDMPAQTIKAKPSDSSDPYREPIS